MSTRTCPHCGRTVSGMVRACPKCHRAIEAAPAEVFEKPETLVRTYRGTQAELARRFERETAELSSRGYYVDGQSVVRGHRSWGTSRLSVPRDQMMVTYRLRKSEDASERLVRLGDLLERGLLTREEFEEQKQKVLEP